jgi:hypothetical protein
MRKLGMNILVYILMYVPMVRCSVHMCIYSNQHKARIYAPVRICAHGRTIRQVEFDEIQSCMKYKATQYIHVFMYLLPLYVHTLFSTQKS